MINTIKIKQIEGLLSRIMQFLAGYTNTMAVSRLFSFALACVFSLGILFSLNHCGDSASPDPPDTRPSDSPGDDHGNDRDSATPVESGTAVIGNIETGDDEDYFSIQVTERGILRASTIGVTDTTGAIYDSAGERLASHDDIDVDEDNKNFDVSYRTAAGVYYVKVGSFETNTGKYSLTVTFTPDGADDHFNTPAHATPVTSGTQVAGNIETGDDQDYFSIEVPGAGTLRAVTTGMTDTVGHLYNDAGDELAINDDGDTDMNFDIVYNVATAGTYYVRVVSVGSGTGMYRLTVTFTLGGIDDHGNDRDSATPIAIGTMVAGDIETSEDDDYFSIEVPGVGTLTAMSTGMTDTLGYLYDSDGNELASDISTGNFNISPYKTTGTGTYYVRVRGFGGDGGEYGLIVTFIPDDHGNTQAHATPVTSGTAVAGNIETGDDQDYFSIAVSGAGTLTAITTGSTDTVGHLYNNRGTQLATDDNGGTGSNFNISSSITAAGTYYLRVTSKDTNTGMYSLTVTFTLTPDVTFMYPELNYSLCSGSIQITPALTTRLDLARISVAISPDLPSGIQISSATGEISGTYSGYHSQSYVVKVSLDSVEETQTNLNLKINAMDQISYPQEAYQFTTDTAITIPITIDPSHPGVVFSVSPALPGGLSLNSSTGQIAGRLSSELGNQDHTVQVVSDECQKQIPLTFCANADGNCPPRFLSSRKIHYADVADAVFPTDATVDEIIKDDKKSAGDHLESRYIGIEVKSFVDDNRDPFTITIVSQTNNNSHPRRTSSPYSYKYRERSIDSAGANKVRKLYFFDGNLTAPSPRNSLSNIQLHRFHKFTTDTLTLRATDGNGRSTEGTIEIRRSPKLKDCTGLTGEEFNECTWLSEILPSGWENNTLTDAVKDKLPNLTQDKDNYRLVFSEEFNGDGDSDHHGLDRSKWRLQGWAGWENNPDANRDDCFFQIEGGTLQMSYLFNCTDQVVALHTLGILEYKYGYMEIKFKLPVNEVDSTPDDNIEYYSNYAGVLWGRYANKYYHTTPVVAVDSIEKYLKYEVVEWDLYEYVAAEHGGFRTHTLFGHWYYINANNYSNFHIPTMQLDRTGSLCYHTVKTETDKAVLKANAQRERVYLEGCNSPLATDDDEDGTISSEEISKRDKFITLTRGWEWTPKGYRTFSHYETDNANDKAKYPDLFSDGLKTSSWHMYWFKYTPYTSKTGFTRSTTAVNVPLGRDDPNLTNRDTEDQLVEIGVMHQPSVLELVVWGRGGPGTYGNYEIPPANTIHPHVFHIDYIRVYKPVDNYKDVAPSYGWAPTLDERCTDSSMC